jgi:hypothetical protein
MDPSYLEFNIHNNLIVLGYYENNILVTERCKREKNNQPLCQVLVNISCQGGTFELAIFKIHIFLRLGKPWPCVQGLIIDNLIKRWPKDGQKMAMVIKNLIVIRSCMQVQ